jgi:hypothetical protein
LRSPAGSLRPFTSSPSYPTSSEESSPVFQESKQQKKQIVFRPSRPVRRPGPPMSSSTPAATSTEDIHYGRPMMMSASSSPSVVKKVVRLPKRVPVGIPIHSHSLPQGHSHGKPILLSSPKQPQLVRSPSIQTSITQPYEPEQVIQITV